VDISPWLPFFFFLLNSLVAEVGGDWGVDAENGAGEKEAFRWATTSFCSTNFRFRKGIISHQSANHHIRATHPVCSSTPAGTYRLDRKLCITASI